MKDQKDNRERYYSSYTGDTAGGTWQSLLVLVLLCIDLRFKLDRRFRTFETDEGSSAYGGISHGLHRRFLPSWKSRSGCSDSSSWRTNGSKTHSKVYSRLSRLNLWITGGSLLMVTVKLFFLFDADGEDLVCCFDRIRKWPSMSVIWERQKGIRSSDGRWGAPGYLNEFFVGMEFSRCPTSNNNRVIRQVAQFCTKEERSPQLCETHRHLFMRSKRHKRIQLDYWLSHCGVTGVPMDGRVGTQQPLFILPVQVNGKFYNFGILGWWIGKRWVKSRNKKKNYILYIRCKGPAANRLMRARALSLRSDRIYAPAPVSNAAPDSRPNAIGSSSK